VSKAVALYRAASHTLNLGRIGADLGLEGLRRTVERAQCFELAGSGSATLLEGLSGIWRP
jgi:hypothetical protein